MYNPENPYQTNRSSREDIVSHSATYSNSACGRAAAQAKQNRQTKQKHGHTSLIKALHSGLICFGMMVLPYSVFAEPAAGTAVTSDTTAPDNAAAQAYDISSSPMEAALDQFAKQTGVDISFSAAEVQGITTQQLKGSFTASAGLNHLLAGSGLEAVPQANGYIVGSYPP